MQIFKLYVDFINETRQVLAKSDGPVGEIKAASVQEAINEITPAVQRFKYDIYGFGPHFYLMDENDKRIDV